jgi:hypothetical protein
MIGSSESSRRTEKISLGKREERKGGQTLLVLLQQTLEIGEAAILVRFGNGLHRFDFWSGIPLSELASDDRCDVLRLWCEAQQRPPNETGTKRRTRLSMTLHSSMYLSAAVALGSS